VPAIATIPTDERGCTGLPRRRRLLLAAALTALVAAAPFSGSRAGPIAGGEDGPLTPASAQQASAAQLQPILSADPGEAEAILPGTASPLLRPAAPQSEAERSLRDVLHRMVNIRRASRPGPRRAAAAVKPASDDDLGDAEEDESPAEALREFLLDSDVLGGVLGRIVATHVADDGSKSFDVLGHGRFSIDVGSDSGEVAMREAESGAALDLQGASREERERARNEAREDSLRLSRLIRNIHAFLVSGEGISLIFLVALALALWGTFRLASRLGRRARALPRRRSPPITRRRIRRSPSGGVRLGRRRLGRSVAR
jgi:hypothetical protein